MIRFFDRKVFRVSYEALNKEILLKCFSQIGMDAAACIVSSDNKYVGEIFYNRLKQSSDVYDAILLDYIVFDCNVWKNAKQYFLNSDRKTVAVVNEGGQLISHAYDDPSSNREMRILYELMITPNVLKFPDIFPGYQCVKIYEFNELAYSFVEYLKSCDIKVCVFGKLWEYLWCKENSEEKCDISDAVYLTIYAEGVWEKENDWTKNLLRSVSVEFECINQIYEANIKSCIIQNSVGHHKDLIQKLKEENEIFIIGSDLIAQDAYDYLKGYGIDICAFVEENQDNYEILGKSVISKSDVIRYYKNAVFLECNERYSAWNDIVDYYDYIGYHRNEKFFLLRDYIEIQSNSLHNTLKTMQIVLTGNIELCRVLAMYLEQSEVAVRGYLELSDCRNENTELPRVSVDNIDEEFICLVALYGFSDLEDNYGQSKKEIIKKCLKEMGVKNYTDYFCNAKAYINYEQNLLIKYPRKRFMPKRIVLGASESCSGNSFFKELLDGHPSIVLITGYGTVWNNNLFWICICLSVMDAESILPLFWKWYGEKVQGDIFNSYAFNKKMRQLLMEGRHFTSQELFVMFHTAYEYMYGRNIEDMQNIIIYWEPHIFPRDRVEENVRWLQADNVSCDIINVVRNMCSFKGSSIKGRVLLQWIEKQRLPNYFIGMWNYPAVSKKIYAGSERIVIRFEDLKCKPEETLMQVCHKWNIEWSEVLLKTTKHGRESSYDNGYCLINNFDMRPVYNTYEEYFSEFDRLRILIIDMPWQKKYGYPYIKIEEFAAREIQEMFLKEFRYEELLEFSSKKEKLNYKISLQNMFRKKLREVRMLEFINE